LWVDYFTTSFRQLISFCFQILNTKIFMSLAGRSSKEIVSAKNTSAGGSSSQMEKIGGGSPSKRGRPPKTVVSTRKDLVKNLHTISPDSDAPVSFVNDPRILGMPTGIRDLISTLCSDSTSIQNECEYEFEEIVVAKKEFGEITKADLSLKLRLYCLVVFMARILHKDYGLQNICDELRRALVQYFSADLCGKTPVIGLKIRQVKRQITTSVNRFMDYVAFMVSAMIDVLDRYVLINFK
jgi:hypothetical protein